MGDTKESRFKRYWKNPEKVRERNRAYYYEKRGLPVPEKKVYKLRGVHEREEAVRDALKKIKEIEVILKLREEEVEKREERLRQIEKSYTLKSYQPTYKPPSEVKQTPVCAVGSAPVQFTISNADFK